MKSIFVAVFLRIYNHKNIPHHMASSTIPPKFITYIPPPYLNTYNQFYLCYYYVILCIQPKTSTLETVSKSLLVVLRGNQGSVDENIRFAYYYYLISYLISTTRKNSLDNIQPRKKELTVFPFYPSNEIQFVLYSKTRSLIYLVMPGRLHAYPNASNYYLR